ncbi:MAG: acyltransferase [Devosia sp.]
MPGDIGPITATIATSKDSGRLAFLDGWRAIAVFVVIQSHLIGFRHDPAWLKLLGRWMPAGQIGVLIFFFISGFVISRGALAEIDKTSAFSLPAFYIRRAFRIIPPLVLYLVVCLGLGALGLVDFHINNAIPAFFYVCNIGPLNQCVWLAGHTWSLAFEEQFYLLFPILISLFILHRRPFIPHLVIVLAFCLAPLIFPVSYIGWFSFVLTYALFTGGCLAARYEAVIARVFVRYANIGFAVAAVAILVTPFTLPVPILADYYPLTFIVTIPVMVLCSGWAHGAVRTVLSNRVLGYLGRISYSIYLWQELATSELFRNQSLLVELAAIVGIVALSAVLFEVMEKPLIQLGRRLSRLVAPAHSEATGARA